MVRTIDRASEWIGHRYGFWEIISTAYKWQGSKAYFLCQCHCPVCERGGELPTVKYVNYYYLCKGKSKGCRRAQGYFKMTENNPSKRKLNDYDLSGEYGVGYIDSAHGKFSFKFDLEDYDLISKYTWHISRADSGYPRTIIRINKEKCKQITMHRLIMGIGELNGNEVDIQVDHINHDTHDNRKSNLRICTIGENALNKEISSPFLGRGVFMQDGKWMVRFKRNGKKIYGGTFDSYEEALQKRIDMEPESPFDYDPIILFQ